MDGTKLGTDTLEHGSSRVGRRALWSGGSWVVRSSGLSKVQIPASVTAKKSENLFRRKGKGSPAMRRQPGVSRS